MTAAQVALTILIVAFTAAGAVLVIMEEDVAGWVLLVTGWFGFFSVLGMVLADAQSARRE